MPTLIVPTEDSPPDLTSAAGDALKSNLEALEANLKQFARLYAERTDELALLHVMARVATAIENQRSALEGFAQVKR